MLVPPVASHEPVVRTARSPAHTSSTKSEGCSKARKWPPHSTCFQYRSAQYAQIDPAARPAGSPAMIAAGVAGLLIGVPALRIGSWTLAMVTFFTVLLVPDIVNLLTDYTGGPGGFIGMPLPSVLGPDLDDTTYFMTVSITACSVAGWEQVRASPSPVYEGSGPTQASLGQNPAARSVSRCRRPIAAAAARAVRPSVFTLVNT